LLTSQEHDMMMLTTNLPTMPSPLFHAWSGVGNLYRDAMQASAQQWVLSSANIIQEHTLRAVINASQSCADALAKNAMTMQQKSMERLMDANQKAAGMMGQAMTDMWMGKRTAG
jgi:hypothetical protein